MNLRKLFAVLWRQRVVVGAVALIGIVTFAFAVTANRKYNATASILAVSSSSPDTAVLDPSKDPIKSAIALQDVPNLLHSSTLLRNVAQQLKLSPDQAAKLGPAIKAKVSFGSAVLPVTVTDTEPRRAVAEANAVVQQLQRLEQRIAMQRYDIFIRDLKVQLDVRRDILSDVDQKINAVTTGDPYMTDANGNQALSARLVALEAQRTLIRATLNGDAAAALLAGTRPNLTQDLARKEIVQNDPVFDALRSQYGKDLARLNSQQAGYTADFPGLVGLQDEVSREGLTLAQTQGRATSNLGKSAAYVAATLDKNKADAALASDRAQLEAIDRELAALRAHLAESHGSNVSLASLRRDRDAGGQVYARLADRLATAQADRAQAASINTIVILDEAAFASLALLSRPLVLGAVIGTVFLWLAISLALLADGADSRLRTRTTIEELYGSPILTTVG